jgi:hypothetical protein
LDFIKTSESLQWYLSVTSLTVDSIRLPQRSADLNLSHRARAKFTKGAACLTALAALALAVPVFASSRIKIDTVPSDYTPVNSPTNREPVSMSSYHFEVNEETGRARLVVEYTYPDQLIYGRNDDALGPPSSIAQLPGLTYDAAAHAVVYESNGARDVCATVEVRRGLFGRHLKIRNTGACTVSAVVANHSEDDGWSIHHFRALDTYLEVH